jgi:plasmid stabilization system protein ParE
VTVDVLGQAEAQRDNIRKMLVAMVDDVRVALIKLAERTCAIRAVKADPERRELVARDVFDVYAPLAHRLGIGHLKWELEDLSFRYLHNDSYMRIARLLDGKRVERDRFIARVRAAAPRACSAMPASSARSADVPSTSTASGGRCSARVSASRRSTTSAPCASWCPRSRTATPRWVSYTACGATSPTNSTTTSPTRRKTATAPCIRR